MTRSVENRRKAVAPSCPGGRQVWGRSGGWRWPPRLSRGVKPALGIGRVTTGPGPDAASLDEPGVFKSREEGLPRDGSARNGSSGASWPRAAWRWAGRSSSWSRTRPHGPSQPGTMLRRARIREFCGGPKSEISYLTAEGKTRAGLRGGRRRWRIRSSRLAWMNCRGAEARS